MNQRELTPQEMVDYVARDDNDLDLEKYEPFVTIDEKGGEWLSFRPKVKK